MHTEEATAEIHLGSVILAAREGKEEENDVTKNTLWNLCAALRRDKPFLSRSERDGQQGKTGLFTASRG